MKRSFKNIKELSPIGKLFCFLLLITAACNIPQPKKVKPVSHSLLITMTRRHDELNLERYLQDRFGQWDSSMVLVNSSISANPVYGSGQDSGKIVETDTTCTLIWKGTEKDNVLWEQMVFTQRPKSEAFDYIICRNDSAIAAGKKVFISEQQKAFAEFRTEFGRPVICPTCRKAPFWFCDTPMNAKGNRYLATLMVNGTPTSRFSSEHWMNYSVGARNDGTEMSFMLSSDVPIKEEGTRPANIDIKIIQP